MWFFRSPEVAFGEFALGHLTTIQGHKALIITDQNIVKLGFEPETVRWVIRTIDQNEYKRRQAAPGLKITSKAFGMGRRIPIAAQFEL